MQNEITTILAEEHSSVLPLSNGNSGTSNGNSNAQQISSQTQSNDHVSNTTTTKATDNTTNSALTNTTQQQFKVKKERASD